MGDPAPQRRRQARGQRRIEQILDAAASVFADVGYAGATTNAIAARSGISPGSLYQFFSNKEAIAEALAAIYTDGLEAAHEAALDDAEALPFDEMVDRVVDPIVAFNIANPGFKSLLADPAVPERFTAATSRLHEELVARVESVIAARAPGLADDDRRRSAVVSVQLVKAMLPLIGATLGPDQDAYVGELKRALRGYLEPLERR